MELYHGALRAIDSEGNITLNDIPTDQYGDYFSEHVERWSYMKFPYLNHLGRKKGWNRVGPLARLNVCDHIPTPLADAELPVVPPLSHAGETLLTSGEFRFAVYECRGGRSPRRPHR